jgi:hypothetical protein
MLSGITWTQRTSLGLAVIAVSYLVATFANASPITQPSLARAGFRGPVVVMAPAPETGDVTDHNGTLRAETPESLGKTLESAAPSALKAL